MAGQTLKRLVDVNSLPTLPSVAIEAIRLMEGEDANFDSIADLLKNDQVLAGRILHYANSAYVGATRKITSISQAISLLGFNTIRSIILSVSIFDCFSKKFSNQKKKLVNFWLHSIGVASTAEILAEMLAFPSPEEAYIAGLIHDLGKLVCYYQYPDEFEQVCTELDRTGMYGSRGNFPLDVEKLVMGTNHIEVGKQIAESWGFPEILGKAMWLHHQPIFETILPDEKNLPQLIRFADVLCVTHNIGSSYFLTDEPFSHEHFHFALENLMLHHHLTTKDLEDIITDVSQRVKEIGKVLGFWNGKAYQKLLRSANMSLGGMSLNLEITNRELAEKNRVFSAIYDMNRKLNPGLSLEDVTQVVVSSVQKAFGVNCCLCMIRNEHEHVFVGGIADGEKYHKFSVPTHLAEMREYTEHNERSDIESEALKQLEQTTVELSQGQVLESGVINMVAGSKFLATFFVADKKNYYCEEYILGELVADFSTIQNFTGENIETLSMNFQTMALSASSAIERILLEIELTHQNHELANAARKMEESQRQLFHAHRLATVGRLAAGAAHEINNPLTVISLNVQILENLIKNYKNNEELRHRLTIIAEQEERISRIIQDLMGYARPTQPEFSQCSLSEIMSKVLSVFGDRVPVDNFTIGNNIPADLPKVMVDPFQVEQVFMNLLINASHAMSEGGTITLSAEAKEGYVEIRVSDTGKGIAKEHLGKVFDPFFTTKQEGEGTGLGLAICHSIVEHNGGVLRVQSKVGAGSTFFVLLPVDKGSRLREMKEELAQITKKEIPIVQEKCRVLVIDDERFINDMLQDSLAAAGYEVDGAYDGVEGIGKLRYKQYHVVLLDIRMPRKDGLEVLQFIKEEFPEIKVIIITGLASTQEVKETVRKGAFACLRKPFRLEKVIETVNRAMNHGGCKDSSPTPEVTI